MLVDIFTPIFNGEIDGTTKMANGAIIQVTSDFLNIYRY